MTQFNTAALLAKLFDEDTFTEIQKYADSGVVAGFGKVSGLTVYALVQDINVKSGAVNKNAAAKMKKIYASAVKYGAPVVAVFNSKGGEIGEGTELIDAYASIIEDCARLSGVVPLVSVAAGQCSGLNATLCCMADIVIMTQSAKMFFTPPDIAADEIEDIESFGSARLNAQTGTVSIVTEDAAEAMVKARELLSLLPSNNLEVSYCGGFEENYAAITPFLKSKELITAIAAKDSLIEINAAFGEAAVTALGVLDSGAVGFVAFDNPDERLTAQDAAKIARFVNICDAFSLPVITIIDNEGFEPCLGAELAGFIRGTAQLAQVYASAATPKISLITGSAAGAAFILAGGFRSDMVLAYEGAIISPVPLKTAAAFLEMDEALYIKTHAGVQSALKKGCLDAVIAPENARNALINAIDAVRDKRVAPPPRKHINFVF
jgi:acetyl-CoA carboxylase carboxyltransferase component